MCGSSKVTLSHEFAGTVVSVGSGVTRFRPGDNVGVDYSIKDTVNLVYIPMTNDAAIADQFIGDYDENYETVTNLIPVTESAKFLRLELGEQ